MGSCVSTLIDWGWEPVRPTVWEDPHGCQWSWNFSRNMVTDAIREVLKVQFKEHLWETKAALHFAGPGFIPDFAAAYALRKRLKSGQDWRRAYYLETILQGAGEDFVAKQVAADDAGAVRCKHCKEP